MFFGNSRTWTLKRLKTRKEDRCVFVDLDFTLVNVNTTFDFLRVFFYRRFFIFSRLLYPLVVVNKIIGSDLYKQGLLFFCAGKTAKTELERCSKAYANYILNHGSQYFNAGLLSQLGNVKHKKILITASIDIIANHLKEALGFDLVISSKTYYSNNGFLRLQDLSHKKHKIVRTFSEKFEQILIIEDAPEPEYSQIKGVTVKTVSQK
jgi:hypothetical protein